LTDGSKSGRDFSRSFRCPENLFDVSLQSRLIAFDREESVAAVDDGQADRWRAEQVELDLSALAYRPQR
jgi:hypothetical protein